VGCFTDPPKPAPTFTPVTVSTTPPPKTESTFVIDQIEFVRLPMQTILLGSATGELGRSTNEHLIQYAQKTPIAISRCEITEQQYWAIKDPTHVVPDATKNHPVTNVTWDEAQEFCELLSSRHSMGTGRLPRESEWEYACRAGNTEMFSFWNPTLQEAFVRLRDYKDTKQLPRKLKKLMRFSSESIGDVGSFEKNEFGLLDMHGNAYEWCDVAEDSMAAWNDSTSLADRPIRGGGWLSNYVDCRSARRAWQPRTDKSKSIGFRVLIELTGTTSVASAVGQPDQSLAVSDTTSDVRLPAPVSSEDWSRSR